MSGQELAALIIAITGALGAIFAGVRNLRGDKFKKDVEASAALLTGYTNMVNTLQTEIDRLKSDHAEDRAAWTAERTAHRKECSEETERLREEHRSQLAIAYERIDDLGSQVYALQNLPPEIPIRRPIRPPRPPRPEDTT